MAFTRDPIHPIPIIVSWAGESWNWPLWGVFQAPHVGFVSIWTLLAWAVGPVAPRLKDTAKQGFNYNQMQHCPPRSSVMLCVRSSSDSRAASGDGGGGDACLFVSKGTKASPCFNFCCQLMPWCKVTIRPFFFFFSCYLFCKRYVLSPNYLWVIINGSPYNW